MKYNVINIIFSDVHEKIPGKTSSQGIAEVVQ